MYYVMNKKGVIMELDSFFSKCRQYDVIFVGEKHDTPHCQEAELAILQGLRATGKDLVLALEMFERDVQPDLDAYLGGRISEEAFLAQSRPWGGYRENYRPLVEFAKDRSIPVVAANVPRRAAAAVAEAGEVSPGVLGEDHRFVPRTLHYDSDEYRERFMHTVAGMGASSPMQHKKAGGLFKAQVLKDAVMAASIEPYLDRQVLFCCGRFHCEYHLGIPFQLRKNHPDLNVTVVTFALFAEEVPMYELSSMGDFIWIEEEDA